jgi:hypothetical protein
MTQGPLSGAPRIHVGASPPMQQVDHGDSATFTLVVTNLSDENQTQNVSVEGVPAAWVTINFDAARQALPREQRNAIVTIAVPEGTQTAAARFRAVARAGEEMSATDCILEVAGVAPLVDESAEELERRPPPPGLALAPSDASLESGGDATAELRLTVRNVGTRETVYALALGGLEATWYELPRQLRVAAGETVDSRLLLRPPVAAGDGAYPFLIRATVEAYPDITADATGELTILAPSAEPVGPREAAPSQARATAAAAAAAPELSLGPHTTFRFGPGEITSDATITVENRSRLLEGYTVSVEGLPDGWYALPLREIRLDPGASQPVALRLTPKPGAEHPAGDYPFRVRIAPHGSEDAFSEVGGVVSVEGTTAFDALVAPLQAQGRKEQYKVTLRNIGTQPVGLLIEGSDPGGMSRFDYPPPPTLDPGEERVLPVKVGVRRNRIVGSPASFDFGLRVLPAGGESTSARTFDARLVHQPYFTARLLKWTLIIAVVIVIIGILFYVGGPRLLDGSDWFRCRFNSSASYCRPNTRALPRTPRIEELRPPASDALGVAVLPAAPRPAAQARVRAARDRGRARRVAAPPPVAARSGRSLRPPRRRR